MTAHFNITCPAVHRDKISVIKALRSLTSMGLKDAKDVSETTSEQVLTVLVHGSYSFADAAQENKFIEDQFQILRNNGCHVGSSVHLILQNLRELGSQALIQGEDELANEILQLVLAEKLRRK